MRIDNWGLAASAVGALAVTGLSVGFPSTPAAAAGEGVVLIAPYNTGHDLSVAENYENNTATLAALRLDPTATISFEYNTNPDATEATAGWTAVPGSVTMTGEYATIDWDVAVMAGTSVSIRAVSTASTTTYSALNDVAISSSAASVDISGPSSVGFFTQPYADSSRTGQHAIVPGCTSAGSGTVELSWWDAASSAYTGQTDVTVSQNPCKIFGPFPGGHTFRGDIDIAAFDADAGDVIAFGTEIETDDVRPVTLYEQVIASISGSAQPVPTGYPTDVYLSVTDTSPSGAVVAGAEVRRLSDGALVGYTDADGYVTTTMNGGDTETFYVNTTDTNAFEDGTDPKVQFTAPTYVQVPTTLTGVSKDGEAFDDDEYSAGDLHILVEDQNGYPMLAGTEVQYRIYKADATPPATYESVNTDGQGRAPVTFAPSGPDGEYRVDFHLGTDSPPYNDQTFTFVAGDAVLTLTPAAGKASPSGTISYDGLLTVGNAPLAGRRIQLTYKRGVEVVPGIKPDAGLGPARKLALMVTTDNTGAFNFIVDDKDERPKAAETGGKVTAKTTAAGGSGNAPTGDAGESDTATSQFGSGKGKAKIKLKGTDGGGTDKLVALGPDSVVGEKVKLFRMVGGKLEPVATKTLRRRGDVKFNVADTNGAATTTYIVKLLPSKRVKPSKSKELPLQ